MSAVFNDVQWQMLEQELERCGPWIESALAHSADSHHLEDVKDAIRQGGAQLWPSSDGCCVTTICNFPASKMCQVWLLGGDFDQVFKEHNHVIESWAKAQGCDQMFVNGRKGWERRLKGEGYSFASVVLAKRI